MAKDSNASKGLNSEYPREKLPKDLQKIVDRQDDWMDNLYEGQYVMLFLLHNGANTTQRSRLGGDQLQICRLCTAPKDDHALRASIRRIHL